MKATIITIFDLTANYGNRLQNYAVQNVLENMGFETESVSFLPDPLNFKCKVKHTLHKLTGYRMPGKKVFWKYGIPRLLVFRDSVSCKLMECMFYLTFKIQWIRQKRN